jgi:hypothetical protein
MKLTIAVLLLTGVAGKTTFLRNSGGTARSLAIDGCPGETDFSVTFDNKCTYANLKDKVYSTRSSSCGVTADALMFNLLGVSSVAEAETKVKDLCREAFANTDETFAFADITKKGTQFDNEYFSGGTYFNYEIQTDDGENELKKDAARIGRVYTDQAQSKVIDLPYYLNSFDPDQDECDINAAFCCWVQDRQAGDNNGNCNTPYESQCIDKDPGDNTNFCYTDHSRSSPTSHVNGGISIFGDVKNNKENIEGAVHCHGFAWAQDDADTSAVYKGNNLFYVSLYDHMYQRGYVRNAPGAPMCGCAENMPVVTRADCTEISAAETFTFDWTVGTSTFSGVLSKVRDLNFNACQGANNRNNDLEAYYRKLVNEGKQTQENLDTLTETLVGTQAGKCNEAIVNFLATKGITRSAEASMSVAASEMSGVEVIDPDYVYEQASAMEESMPDVPGSMNEAKDTLPAKEVVAEALPVQDDEIVAIADEDDETAISEEGEPCEIDENCSTNNCLENQICGPSTGGGDKNEPDVIGGPVIDRPGVDEPDTDTGNDTWEEIAYDDFEASAGIWGSAANKRLTGQSMDGGSYSLRMKKSQTLRSDWIDVQGYSEVKIKFHYYGSGMEAGEGFMLKGQFNKEQFVPLEEWMVDTDFANGEWKEVEVTLAAGGKNRLQWEFVNIANQGNDRVYIDNVSIEGM